MRRIAQLDPDDSRIAGLAALITLGGHAAAILLALAVFERSVSPPEISQAVSVTLVTSGGSGQAASSAPARALNQLHGEPTDAHQVDFEPSGERLDDLSASPSGAQLPETPSGRASLGSGAGPGEGVAGIDLYAVAGLPAVGQRPAVSPDGDLWQKVAPCWRPSATRAVTLSVEIQEGGNLGAAIQAIRRPGRASDALTLAAERSALRALQGCAPYPGIATKRWRIDFPAVGPEQIQN